MQNFSTYKVSTDEIFFIYFLFFFLFQKVSFLYYHAKNILENP